MGLVRPRLFNKILTMRVNTMTNQEYVDNCGEVCPNCGGRDIDKSNISCENCGATWTEVFHLTGFCDLEVVE